MYRLILIIVLILFAQQRPQPCLSRPTRGCRSSEHDEDIQRRHNITHSDLLLAGARDDQSRTNHAPLSINGLQMVAVRKHLKHVSASTDQASPTSGPSQNIQMRTSDAFTEYPYDHSHDKHDTTAQNMQIRMSQGPTDEDDDVYSYDIIAARNKHTVQERKKKLQVHGNRASAHIKVKDQHARLRLIRRQIRALVGSSPPKCAKKCGSCNPCRSVLVPIHSIPSTAASAEYYPEAWRCQCGGRTYNP